MAYNIAYMIAHFENNSPKGKIFKVRAAENTVVKSETVATIGNNVTFSAPNGDEYQFVVANDGSVSFVLKP